MQLFGAMLTISCISCFYYLFLTELVYFIIVIRNITNLFRHFVLGNTDVPVRCVNKELWRQNKIKMFSCLFTLFFLMISVASAITISLAKLLFTDMVYNVAPYLHGLFLTSNAAANKLDIMALSIFCCILVCIYIKIRTRIMNQAEECKTDDLK